MSTVEIVIVSVIAIGVPLGALWGKVNYDHGFSSGRLAEYDWWVAHNKGETPERREPIVITRVAFPESNNQAPNET